MNVPRTPDEEKAFMDRLDGNAKTLVGATTLTFALLTAFGVSSDKLPVVLNSSSTAKILIIAAVVCAVLAVMMGLLAVGTRSAQREGRWISGGVFLLFASLIMVTWAASTAFTEDGRPTINDIAVAATDDSTATVTFTIRADGVKRDTLLRVFGTWVRTSAEQSQGIPLYTSTLRPNDKGVVEQKVTMTLARPKTDKPIRLQVYPEAAPIADPHVAPPVGASCSNQQDQQTAAACTMIIIPKLAAAAATKK